VSEGTRTTLAKSRSCFIGAAAALALLSGCEPTVAPKPAASADAVVTDDATGLRWLRCALGQTWQDGRCVGEAQTFTLMDAQARVEALNAERRDGITQWRLPAITELAALRKCDQGFVAETFSLDLGPEQQPVVLKRWCAGETTIPAIDAARFPDTPSVKFWSGSGSETHQHFYAVDFGTAWIGLNEAAEARHAVRPVADRAR
jgi:hypothetical protein